MSIYGPGPVGYAPPAPQEPQWWESTARAGFSSGGEALGAAGATALGVPPAIGTAMGGALGGAFGDMFNEFFDEDEEPQMVLPPPAPTDYSNLLAMGQKPSYQYTPPGLSSQYGVQSPYGYGFGA